MSETKALALVKRTEEKKSANPRVWTHSGDSYFLGDSSQQMEKLPAGNYRLQITPLGELYLKQTDTSFSFDYKIYETDQAFVDRVERTYLKSKGNLGVLLNGVKGTGKSVTAKQICNKMALPVIIVTDYFPGLPMFLNDIHQDLTVFIDEYEKIYKDYQNSILTVMDGVLSSSYRRLFLLTTNDLYINENLLQRPSRIYYLKTYDNISLDVMNSILDDMLDYQEHRDDLLKFLGEMSIITIDLVKAVIQEVNLHNESPYAFKEIFNVRNHKNELYDLFDITDPDKPKSLGVGMQLDMQFSEANIGRDLYIGHQNFGKLKKLLDKDTGVFEHYEYEQIGKAENDMEDEDYDKLEELKKTAAPPKRVMKHTIIRKEVSSQFNNIRQFII